MRADDWKERVIDALIVNGGYRAAHDDNPKLAVDDLIKTEITMACDPAISTTAEALVQRGRREAREYSEAVSHLNDTIQDWCNAHAKEVPEPLLTLLANLDMALNGP